MPKPLFQIKMIDNQKRYQKKRDDDPKHLGNYIKWHLESNKIKKKSVSDFLNVQAITLNRYFKQPSFQFSILWRISLAVKHNFLMQLGEELNIPYETKAEKELKTQLELLKQENRNLKRDNELLKEILKR